MSDIYYTIEHPGEGVYKEKMSKFLSFARFVTDSETVKQLIKDFQNKYHDARHVCWAYMIGPQRQIWQINDNGEPSGTAGKPILGQINSFDLTNVLVVVVRYFGGIKLGTSGLITAYKEAARLALESAGKKEVHELEILKITFPYTVANDIMKVVKSEEMEVLDKSFDNACEMTCSFRKDYAERIRNRLSKINGLSVID